MTHGLSWDENYGAGGAPGGANISYTVAADGVRVTFSYVLGDARADRHERGAPDRCPISTQQQAHWLERDLARLGPSGGGERVELPAARRPTGGLVVDEEAILGGESFPLTLDPAGLPADEREQWPHLAGVRRAAAVAPRRPRRRRTLLTGQLAVAAYDDLGRLVDATGVQIPGVLDDVYDDAYDRDLGVTWHGRTPKLAVWAPTAKDVDLLVRLPGASDRHARSRCAATATACGR